MKVGTDAVLIGSWVNASNSKTILDIGTGTGIIALMLAQKSGARIDAIDIDNNAFEQAQENVNNCNWKERITVHHVSLQQFVADSTQKYDLIVSNPPYFVDSSKAIEESRTNARHHHRHCGWNWNNYQFRDSPAFLSRQRQGYEYQKCIFAFNERCGGFSRTGDWWDSNLLHQLVLDR